MTTFLLWWLGLSVVALFFNYALHSANNDND